MSEEKMPVAEATAVEETNESNHYEFAFHVLPTVAEGEVAGVFDTLKAHITNAGGDITTEEAPQRIDLAYEIIKQIDGKNRKFASAYFGWVRFTLVGEKLADLNEELEGMSEILRSLIIKLTRTEEAEPFFYHEAMANEKQHVIVGDAASAVEEKTVETDPSEGAVEDDEDKEGEVSEEELEDSLEKITQ